MTNYSQDRIATEAALAQLVAPVGSKWRHKKGGEYLVLGYGFDTERSEVNIHYRSLTHESVLAYDRPLSMWTPDRFTQLN